MCEPNQNDVLSEACDHLRKGLTLMRAGDLFGAERCYKEALAKSPHNAIVWGRMAMLYVRMNAIGKADKHFRKALAIDPENVYVLCNYGSFCLKFLDDPQKAERVLLKALEIEPYRVGALNQLSLFYAKAHRDEEAERYLLRYLEADKKGVAGYHQLGLIYLRRGDEKGAEEMFRTCFKINQQDVHGRHQLGELFQKQGKFDKAEHLFLRCIEIQPDNIVARKSLALLYAQMHRNAEAERVWMDILALDRNDICAGRKLAYLRRLRSEQIERSSAPAEIVRKQDETMPRLVRINRVENETASVRQIRSGNSDRLSALMCTVSK